MSWEMPGRTAKHALAIVSISRALTPYLLFFFCSVGPCTIPKTQTPWVLDFALLCMQSSRPLPSRDPPFPSLCLGSSETLSRKQGFVGARDVFLKNRITATRLSGSLKHSKPSAEHPNPPKLLEIPAMRHSRSSWRQRSMLRRIAVGHDADPPRLRLAASFIAKLPSQVLNFLSKSPSLARVAVGLLRLLLGGVPSAGGRVRLA